VIHFNKPQEVMPVFYEFFGSWKAGYERLILRIREKTVYGGCSSPDMMNSSCIIIKELCMSIGAVGISLNRPQRVMGY